MTQHRSYIRKAMQTNASLGPIKCNTKQVIYEDLQPVFNTHPTVRQVGFKVGLGGGDFSSSTVSVISANLCVGHKQKGTKIHRQLAETQGLQGEMERNVRRKTMIIVSILPLLLSLWNTILLQSLFIIEIRNTSILLQQCSLKVLHKWGNATRNRRLYC